LTVPVTVFVVFVDVALLLLLLLLNAQQRNTDTAVQGSCCRGSDVTLPAAGPYRGQAVVVVHNDVVVARYRCCSRVAAAVFVFTIRVVVRVLLLFLRWQGLIVDDTGRDDGKRRHMMLVEEL
jgi:hypothetical protein